MSPRVYNRWILTKSCEFAPDGNLRLGQILAEPKDPAYVLQPNGPLPLHGGIQPEITSRMNVSIHDNDQLSAQFRTWADLGYIPMKFQIASSKKQSHKLDWHFEKLESRIISPDLEYVKSAMRHGDVEESLRNWRNPFKRRVYMVTGVRVVSGACFKRREAASTKHSGAIDGVVPDMTVSVGSQATFGTSSSEAEVFEKASDFVYAYRLNEVKYRGKITQRPFEKGEAASAASTGKILEQRKDMTEISDFEVTGMAELDLPSKKKDFEPMLVVGHREVETFLARDDKGLEAPQLVV
ncbi:hypothetical protein E8E13_003680 [Curvularia kusanoi]|uniref:Uncharacterized protein n=1 Tax=Curvularia kusanoi TaxID=90978 RepID=A0A9P4T7K8_CURKU|nr:hypothetical protein E8E13_003680 [Curvularia kusanoi]